MIALIVISVWLYIAGGIITRAMLENDLPLINRTVDTILWPLLVTLTVVVAGWHFAEKRIKEVRAAL